MFKAPIKVASHNPISNKDRKKLKKDLTKDFPSDVVDMIFIKSSEISATKLQGSSIVIYSDEEFPLFVDSTGNGDFFPSLYTVDAYPDICRTISMKSGVESFLLKGANLMWPGVADIEELPADLEADSVVVVRKEDGVPVAVGALAEDVEKVQNGKQEGVACYILHLEGDSLWNAGSKQHGEVKWDRKTQEEEEKKLLEKAQKKKERKGDEEEEEIDYSQLLGKTGGGGGIISDMGKGKAKQMPKELKTGKDTGGPKPKGKEEKATKDKGGKGEKDDKKGKKDKDHKDAKDKDDKDKGKGKGGKKGNKKAKESESESEEEAKPTKEVVPAHESEEDSEDWKNEKKGKAPKKKETKDAKQEDKDDEGVTKEQMKEMDEKIMEAFLNATKIAITDKDLPIECGKLWTNFIIKCKGSDHDDLDFKLSSYKKIGKFLQVLNKDKILTYEEASKKNPVPKVTKIDFSHKKIEDWEPTVTAKQLEQRNSKDDDEKGSAKDSWRVQIEVVKQFKPNDAVKRFVEE